MRPRPRSGGFTLVELAVAFLLAVLAWGLLFSVIGHLRGSEGSSTLHAQRTLLEARVLARLTMDVRSSLPPIETEGPEIRIRRLVLEGDELVEREVVWEQIDTEGRQAIVRRAAGEPPQRYELSDLAADGLSFQLPREFGPQEVPDARFVE